MKYLLILILWAGANYDGAAVGRVNGYVNEAACEKAAAWEMARPKDPPVAAVCVPVEEVLR